MEIIFIGAFVALALVFLMRNLYNKFNGNSACCCEESVCPKKKKTEL